MKRALIAIAALVLVAGTVAPSFAQDGVKFGFGYFRPEAPVGGRAWINENVAVDVGIGLEMSDVPEVGGNGVPTGETEKGFGFTFDFGVPYVVLSDESTKFFIRPGIVFNSDPSDSETSATTLWVSGSLGVEHWFSERFSVQAAHGVAFESYDSGVDGADSVTRFFTEDFGVSSIGFHFYVN